MDGESCWFVSHDKMKEALAANEFLDVGEHDNYLFGTNLGDYQKIVPNNYQHFRIG